MLPSSHRRDMRAFQRVGGLHVGGTHALVAASGALKLKVTSRVVGCGIPSFVGGEDAFDDYLTANGSTEEFNAWKKRKRDEEMELHVREFRTALAARTNS